MIVAFGFESILHDNNPKAWLSLIVDDIIDYPLHPINILEAG